MIKDFLKKINDRLENSPLAPFMQFIRFGLVGVTSTLISYGMEMLLYYVIFRHTEFAPLGPVFNVVISADQVRVMTVTVIAFAVSVTNSYLLNSRFTFQSEEKRTVRQHLRAYVRTVASYALTGLFLAPAIKMGLVGLNIPFYIASLASLLVTIPINFILNKFWAFRKKEPAAETAASKEVESL